MHFEVVPEAKDAENATRQAQIIIVRLKCAFEHGVEVELILHDRVEALKCEKTDLELAKQKLLRNLANSTAEMNTLRTDLAESVRKQEALQRSRYLLVERMGKALAIGYRAQHAFFEKKTRALELECDHGKVTRENLELKAQIAAPNDKLKAKDIRGRGDME